jgi:hypothetical protein
MNTQPVFEYCGIKLAAWWMTKNWRTMCCRKNFSNSKVQSMRRKYSVEERAAWNKRYYQRKKQLGWTTCSFLTPVNVSKKTAAIEAGTYERI